MNIINFFFVGYKNFQIFLSLSSKVNQLMLIYDCANKAEILYDRLDANSQRLSRMNCMFYRYKVYLIEFKTIFINY